MINHGYSKRNIAHTAVLLFDHIVQNTDDFTQMSVLKPVWVSCSMSEPDCNNVNAQQRT